MAKLTMYFDSTEDMRAYFTSGRISSMYLVYVKDANDNYVLYTADNNFDGIIKEYGGYIDSPEETEQKEEELDLSEDILNGTQNPE